MQLIRSQVLPAVCCLALLVPPAFGQGASDLDMLNRLHDATQRMDNSFATVQLSLDDGTLSTVMEKRIPNALVVRAELDGKPIKLARGSKPKVVENVTPGTLVVRVERPLHGTAQRTECTGYLGNGLQEVLIYPQGDNGVQCQFYDVASSAAVDEPLPAERIPDWELALSFEQFAAVGDCHNDHAAGSAGFWACVETAGVSRPAERGTGRSGVDDISAARVLCMSIGVNGCRSQQGPAEHQLTAHRIPYGPEQWRQHPASS